MYLHYYTHRNPFTSTTYSFPDTAKPTNAANPVVIAVSTSIISIAIVVMIIISTVVISVVVRRYKLARYTAFHSESDVSIKETQS